MEDKYQKQYNLEEGPSPSSQITNHKFQIPIKLFGIWNLEFDHSKDGAATFRGSLFARPVPVPRFHRGHYTSLVRAASLLFLLFMLGIQLSAQRDHRYLRKGDDQYRKEDYKSAEENYRQSLENKNSAQGNYNLGNSIYQQGRFDEAIKRYEEAAELSNNPQAKAFAYHNLGNAYFQSEDYEKSVEAYKNALRINPDDTETKINLAQALRRIPPPPPPSEDQQQDQDQSENENQEEQEQQQQQNQEQQDQEQQENQQAPNENDQPQENEPQPQEGDISREEAERLLKIAEEEEQQTMERLRKEQSNNCRSDKKW